MMFLALLLIALVVQLPGKSELAIALDEQLRFDTFIAEYFAYFDRDGDGSWSAAEAGKAFVLPGVKTMPDGKMADLKSFVKRNGFEPLIVRVVPPSPEKLRASATIVHFLEQNADASRLLRRFDENEDEYLTPLELVDDSKPLPHEPITITNAEPKGPTLTLRQKWTLTNATEVMKVEAKNDTLHIQHPKWSIVANSAQSKLADRTGFALAQFRSALGDQPSLERKSIEGDPTFDSLDRWFAFADRDEDGKLTPTEAEKYLRLIEQGIRCQTVVIVADHGVNAFDRLDTNGDDRLHCSELLNATAKDIPHQISIGVQAGNDFRTFGMVPITARPKAVIIASKSKVEGPKWFQAMDRNGDGLVSTQEYVGSVESFRKHDRNRDGVISPDETE